MPRMHIGRSWTPYTRIRSLRSHKSRLSLRMKVPMGGHVIVARCPWAGAVPKIAGTVPSHTWAVKTLMIQR